MFIVLFFCLSKRKEPKEKDTRQLGLRLPSAALHGIKDRGRTTIKTDWWRVWDRKVASGSLIASYYHVSFGAKARANSLCEFFAIIDMLSKTDFWILMAESVYAVFPGRFHYRCHGHS